MSCTNKLFVRKYKTFCTETFRKTDRILDAISCEFDGTRFDYVEMYKTRRKFRPIVTRVQLVFVWVSIYANSERRQRYNAGFGVRFS